MIPRDMTPASLIVRPYYPSDLVNAASLWYGAWHEERPGQVHPYVFEQWIDAWLHRVLCNAVVWVAVRDGRHAGQAALFPGHAHLTHVVVAPPFRRCGIGSRLLDQLKSVSPNGLTL